MWRGGELKVDRCRPSVLVIVAVVWLVPSRGYWSNSLLKTRSLWAWRFQRAAFRDLSRGLVCLFFACGVRWVKFPCFVILDFGSVLSVGSHGWRQSVDTKVGRSLIRIAKGKEADLSIDKGNVCSYC
ncbi:hypothetical protein Tco_0740370 [Tanacetum coccineum]